MKTIYFFAVLAILGTACSKTNDTVVEAEKQYPTTPVNMWPTDNAIIQSGGYSTYIEFSWGPCTDPQGDPVSYDIIIEDFSGYSLKWLTTTSVAAEFHYIGTGKWKVIARDNHGNISESHLNTFTINPGL